MSDDLLKGAFSVGRVYHKKKIKADIKWAVEIEMTVIAAGQQVLASGYEFSETQTAEWAQKTLVLARMLFQMMKPKQSPPTDQEFARMVAKTVIDGGAQALQTNYQFTPEQATEWARRTLALVTESIKFARRSKKPRKPKAKR